jgi:hypothetical protein
MCLNCKDAWFVHESFRNETYRVVWDFWSYETNPRNESFENWRIKTNPLNESFGHRRTKRIHETNLLKTRGFANPNPKDSDGFVRIRKDLLDSLDLSNLLKTASQNESRKRIFWKLRLKTIPRNESFENWVTKRIQETNLLKTASRNKSTKQIFWKLRLKTIPQNESFENWVTKRIQETNLLKTASRNKSTKQIFWKLRLKTIPRNESFENWVTKRIHESNLLKTDKSKRNKSTFLQISYTIPASLLNWQKNLLKNFSVLQNSYIDKNMTPTTYFFTT